MMSLFRTGLDRETILEECDLQSALAGHLESPVWEAFLLVKIEEMEERYGVSVPWKRLLKSRAEIKLGANRLMKEIDRGTIAISRLSEVTKENPEFTRKCLRYLKEIGEIRIDRKTRPHQIRRKLRTREDL
jgi:hypothetical protein